MAAAALRSSSSSSASSSSASSPPPPQQQQQHRSRRGLTALRLLLLTGRQQLPAPGSLDSLQLAPGLFRMSPTTKGLTPARVCCAAASAPPLPQVLLLTPQQSPQLQPQRPLMSGGHCQRPRARLHGPGCHTPQQPPSHHCGSSSISGSTGGRSSSGSGSGSGSSRDVVARFQVSPREEDLAALTARLRRQQLRLRHLREEQEGQQQQEAQAEGHPAAEGRGEEHQAAGHQQQQRPQLSGGGGSSSSQRPSHLHPQHHQHQHQHPHPHPHPHQQHPHPQHPQQQQQVVLPGSLSPPPAWASGGLARRLWWAYTTWLCSRWLCLSVYGMSLSALAARWSRSSSSSGSSSSNSSSGSSSSSSGSSSSSSGGSSSSSSSSSSGSSSGSSSSTGSGAGVIVVANHQSQLDPALMTVALRCLGVDEVLVLGEQDVATTLTAALLGNVLPLLPLPPPLPPHQPDLDPTAAVVRSDVDEAALAAAIRAELQARTYGGGGGGKAGAKHTTTTATAAAAATAAASSAAPSAPPPPPPPPRSPAARRALVVFPERGVGGREGALRRPWRLSVAALAAALGCPVVPAFISGSQRALPRHWSIPRRRRVAVEVGLPLAPGQASDARLLEAMGMLRATVRARRAGGWRARPRNRRPAPASGLLGAAENAVWLAAGWLSVVAAAAAMAALWVADGLKVAVLVAARALAGLAAAAVAAAAGDNKEQQ